MNKSLKEWILSDEQRKVRKNTKTNDKIYMKAKPRRQNKVMQITRNYMIWPSIHTNNDLTQNTTLDIFESIDTSSPEMVETNSVVSSLDSNISCFDSDSDQIDVSELAVTPIDRPITDYRNTLTEVEGSYLRELLNATSILKTPIGTIASEATTLIDALSVLSGARTHDIQRYVSMSKSLIAFKNICQKDRYSILRPGLIEMFFMRNVTGYFNDNDKEYYIIPTVSSYCFASFVCINYK